MEYEVTLDNQGRLVLPGEIRKRLGLRPGSKTLITWAGNKLVITLEDARLKTQIEDWYNQLLQNKAQAFESTEEWPESKWISEAYGKRKAGLVGRNS